MRKLFVAAATAANFALLVTPGVRRQGAGKGNGKGGARSTTTADSSITIEDYSDLSGLERSAWRSQPSESPTGSNR